MQKVSLLNPDVVGPELNGQEAKRVVEDLILSDDQMVELLE
jgi:hypothetical protein